MAKSLRSKQKRRMKAIKRVRYGEKELKRLVEMVQKAEKNVEESGTSMDIDKCPQNFITVKTMETDQTERDPKTMLNKFGQYPEWMSGRRLKKQKKIVKKIKKRKQKC